MENALKSGVSITPLDDEKVSEFWKLLEKLCYNPNDNEAEAQVVHFLLELMTITSFHTVVSNILQKTQILCVIVRTLGVEERLHSLVARGYVKDYLGVIELASEANPQLTLCHILREDSEDSEFKSFLTLFSRISLVCDDVTIGQACCDSLVRSISFLLSDAQNCSVLLSGKYSPFDVFCAAVKDVPEIHQFARLMALKGLIQVLLHTANFTKVWVEHFSIFSGPALCWSFLVHWCEMGEEECMSLSPEDTLVFETLCLLLALPDAGRKPSYSFYLCLKGAHWEQDDREPSTSTYLVKVGSFGLKVTLQAATASMKFRPTVFPYLALLVFKTIRIGSADIIATGGVSEDLVHIIRKHALSCAESDDPYLGIFIGIIVRLCASLCVSQETFAKQKSGAVNLCALVIELSAKSTFLALSYAIRTIILISNFSNEELFFTYLVSAQLFTEITKRLLSTKESEEFFLILRLLTDMCSKVPALQDKFLPFSRTVVDLMRTQVHNGPRLFICCSKLLNLVLTHSGDDAVFIYDSLKDLIVQNNFSCSKSIMSGCWGLQTCVQLVRNNNHAMLYLSNEVNTLLCTLSNLCLRISDEYALVSNGDFCQLFGKMRSYHRHQRDSAGTSDISSRYLLLCDFLILLLHLFCVIQTNVVDDSCAFICERLTNIIRKGPFLQCRFYTSIVVRTFIGLSSQSSAIVFRALTVSQDNLGVEPVTRQDLSSDWFLIPSYGDAMFAYEQQRILRPSYMESLQHLLAKEATSAQSALLASSIIQLFVELFNNSQENICILTKNKTAALLAKLFAVVISEKSDYKQKCFERLVNVTKHLGVCGVNQEAMLYLMKMCVQDLSDELVEYDSHRTEIVLRLWRWLFVTSFPFTQPVAFYGLAPGYPIVAGFHLNAVSRMKKDMGFFGGLDIPIQRGLSKHKSCLSAVIWFFVETSPHKVDCLPLSLCFDQGRTCLVILLSSDGTLKVRVGIKGAHQLRSKEIPVPDIKVPSQQWCMLCVSLLDVGWSSLRSKIVLNIHISLQTVQRNTVPLLYYGKEIAVRLEMSLGVLEKTDNLFREVTGATLGMTCSPTRNIMQQFLFGSLAVFDEPLSRLEILLLFAMGSDNLFSLSFTDFDFIVGLYPSLANVLLLHEMTLVEEILLLTAMWIKYESGCGREDFFRFSELTFPFSRYLSKERLPVLVGVCDGELCMEGNVDFFGPFGEYADQKGPNTSVVIAIPDRLVRSKPIIPITLKLSTDHHELQRSGKTAVVDGLRFHLVSPCYSVLDAFGGIPFFIWLATLQKPSSHALEEAWKCMSSIITCHCADRLFYQIPSCGGSNLVSLLRATLHTRITVTEQIAVAVCEAVGQRIILRADLLPLLLNFALWSQEPIAFGVVLRKLQQFLTDEHYGQFNHYLLQNGIDVPCDVGCCFAVEEFFLHLIMYFAGDTNGMWDVSLISLATPFIITLSKTTFHLRRIIQTVICFTISEEMPLPLAVEWALGLLGAAQTSMQSKNEIIRDEYLTSDILALFKCPSEAVRSKALSLLSWVVLGKEHLSCMVDEYLARKTMRLNLPWLSENEIKTMFDAIEQSVRVGSTDPARVYILFLLVLLVHMPCSLQSRIVAILKDVTLRKGPLIHDLVFPKDRDDVQPFSVSVQYYILSVLKSIDSDSPLMESLVQLILMINIYMVEISWDDDECASSGRVLSDTTLAVIFTTNTIRDIELNGGISNAVKEARSLSIHFCAPCLETFTRLSKQNCSKSFLNDYLTFFQAVATVIVLLLDCNEGDLLDNLKTPEENALSDVVLETTYMNYFGKSLCLSSQRTGWGLILLFFECTRRLMFVLQMGDAVPKEKDVVNSAYKELLLLQWKIAVFTLYTAEKNDDDIVRDLVLLHLAHSGTIQYGYNTSTWEKKNMLVKAPKNSTWRQLNFSSNTLLTELLKNGVRTESLKESAPWLILLRAAMSFLNSSKLENTGAFSTAISLCRLVRYNTNIWTLVKSGLSSSTVTELDAVLCSDKNAQSSHEGTSSGFFWGIEFSRQGVAALEKYVQSVRLSSLTVLRRFHSRPVPLLLKTDPKRAAQRHVQVSPAMHQFQASLWRRADLYKRSIQEDDNIVLATHAAYRFALLPWWGHLVSLYSQTPVPLNRWELDRFMGPEWQRCRFRRFIHDAHITTGNDTSQLIRAVYRKSMTYPDDVALLEFDSITAVPQLLTNQLLGTGSFAVKCKLVLPMDRVPIMLYVSSQRISYVVEWFTHRPAQVEKESMHTQTGNPIFVDTYDPVSRLPKMFKYKHEIPRIRRVIDVSFIRAVWPRRNLLQSCALEIFFSTGESLFLAFDSEELRKHVSDLITGVARPYLDKTLFLNEANLKMWRNWWCEGRITNFQYLMYLNLASGRSYGDLRQYPIFPHIVADFLSDTLDLTSSASFRRLAYPMGAQTTDREEKAVAKYAEIASNSRAGMQNDTIDLIPHHHGSHYSPLGGVLHFLVRVQPFTDYFLDMNSKLDDADRVFDSMATAYAISTGKDVKELVPELYCVSDVFVNSNHIPFGTKQNGEMVDNVQLPPWASSPRELGQKLLEALESRYVSENLHSWIDLIFGFKQRGKEAIATVNVFHPLTYEGSVDLASILDPVLRSSHETQIDCFGQTPLQLFIQPHKQRVKLSDLPFFQSPCPTLRYDASAAKTCALLHPKQLIPSNSYKANDGTNVVFVRSKHTTAARGAEESSEWKFPLSQTRPITLPKGFVPFTIINDQLRDCIFFRLNCLILVDAKDWSREVSSFHVTNGKITICAVDYPMVFVGLESGAIHVIKITNEECGDVHLPCKDEGVERASVLDIVEKILRDELKSTRVRATFQSRMCLLYGHTAPVTALTVSHEWGILVSSAMDYTVAIWDISRCVLLRTIPSPSFSQNNPESLLTEIMWQFCEIQRNLWYYNLITVNAKEGDIILAGHSQSGIHAVRMFTLNGLFVGDFSLDSEPATAILSVGAVVFIAHGSTVRVVHEKTMQWICDLTHPNIEDNIESLALSPTGNILAACDRKANLVTWKVTP